MRYTPKERSVFKHVIVVARLPSPSKADENDKQKLLKYHCTIGIHICTKFVCSLRGACHCLVLAEREIIIIHSKKLLSPLVYNRSPN